MGQYYKAVILAEDKKTPKTFVESWDFKNGAKLTEHSYIGNVMLGVVESLIQDNPSSLVWAGDYADIDNGADDNIYCLCETNGECVTPNSLNKKSHLKKDKLFMRYAKLSDNKNRYIINTTKKEFVDKTKCPYYLWNGTHKFALHPLALLTTEGNQRGGGDYYGSNEHLVGSWSRDIISVSDTKPTDDYVEIIPNFVEEYYEEEVIYPMVELVNA
jgi:hypothetical protein